MDPVTTVGTGLAVLGSKELLGKVLGPTAEYLGNEAKGLVEKCNINLNEVFAKALRKLGPRAEEAGSVNPRVFKHVIDEGRFCEDPIAAEYFGGVLASSKTPNGRDDRGVTVMGIIKEMSVYQIRCHYVVYHSVYSFFQNTELNIGIGEDCTKMSVYFPIDMLVTALDLSQGENPWEIMVHCATGLYGRGLIGNNRYGGPDHLQKEFKEASKPGIILQPTLRGAELFMWANGQQGATGHEIFKVGRIKALPEVIFVPGAIPTKKMPEIND